MNINKLVGKLVGDLPQAPMLVVGGAPSAPAELQKLRDNGFVPEEHIIISANEHALHLGLKPQFSCVNDDVHHTLNEFQEPRLRKLMPDTLLLSRHWWADYRSPQLMPCNSGMKAILYAAILGANPVVVIGIQHYQQGLYFHDGQGKQRKSNPNEGRGESYFKKQTSAIQAKLKGVPVRPVGGPLTQVWKQWSPGEKFAPRELCEMEQKAQADAAEMKYLFIRNHGFAFEAALVPQGMVFAVTKFELLERRGSLDVADATAWDLSDMNKALAADIAAGRAEQDRLRRMIAKVRLSRRGISRSIYDADIVRIIKWAEEGISDAGMAQRSGLPAEQARFVAAAAGVDRRVGVAIP